MSNQLCKLSPLSVPIVGISASPHKPLPNRHVGGA
jgi:hypothetical protein